MFAFVTTRGSEIVHYNNQNKKLLFQSLSAKTVEGQIDFLSYCSEKPLLWQKWGIIWASSLKKKKSVLSVIDYWIISKKG